MMGIKIEILETKVHVFDNINSITYCRMNAPKYRNFYQFKKDIMKYEKTALKASYAEILSLGLEHELVGTYSSRGTKNI